MGLDVNQRAFEYLQQNPEKRFTGREIAQWVIIEYPKECQEKRDRSKATLVSLDDDSALAIQLSAEIKPEVLKRKHPQIKTTSGRPRKFYYTESSDAQEVEQAEAEQSASTDKKRKNAAPESELYQKLSDYMFAEASKIYSTRIDEKRSKNKKGAGANRWLYPDVVGFEVLSQDWIPEIKECAEFYSSRKAKLWSFEVKVIINRSNARPCFLQAVTNSSWANLGYLVAKEIDENALSELHILANLHGIGVIELNVGSPLESQILIPAKERVEVDWNTANRLADENDDFKEYIERIIDFHKTGKVREKEWDGKELDS